MREHKYILDADGNAIPEPDVLKWGKWFEENRLTRRVAYDEIGGVKVSTIFLGIDNGWLSDYQPILWETMIFGLFDNEWQEQYTSREAAVIGHAEAVALVKASLTK
jgi:hypothetical protein